MKKRIIVILAVLAIFSTALVLALPFEPVDLDAWEQTRALKGIERELRQGRFDRMFQPKTLPPQITVLPPYLPRVSKSDWIQLEINQSVLARLANLERQNLLHGKRIASLEQKVKVLQRRDWKRK